MVTVGKKGQKVTQDIFIYNSIMRNEAHRKNAMRESCDVFSLCIKVFQTMGAT